MLLLRRTQHHATDGARGYTTCAALHTRARTRTHTSTESRPMSSSPCGISTVLQATPTDATGPANHPQSVIALARLRSLSAVDD